MTDKYLHIIAFRVPYPANNGGVIDVFYKIRSLHQQGVKIILHCFLYGNVVPSAELEKYCEKIFYYERKTGLKYNLSFYPYIVLSRKNLQLLENLQKDEYPILFEGLHSCYYLANKELKNRKKYCRTANIEHLYYWHLCKAEKSLRKKMYYLIEAVRLFAFQHVLKYSTGIFAISTSETDYFRKRLKSQINISYIPAFHHADEFSILQGVGKYMLYHGNLSVAENEAAAVYLIQHILKGSSLPLIVAGLNPSKYLMKIIDQCDRKVVLVKNPTDKELDDLIANAQLHILYTFQATGFKLKLLKVLSKGRFCIANDKMLQGTDLDKFCICCHTKEEMRNAIAIFSKKEITREEILRRETFLKENFSNSKNAQKIVETIFEEIDFN